MKQKLSALLLIAVCWSGASMQAGAAVVQVNGKIIQSFVHEQFWGQCAARLSTSLQGSGLNCDTNFVTFACDGSVPSNTKSNAQTMFNSALLAGVTDTVVAVIVDDAIKINGFCYAKRIDNTF